MSTERNPLLEWLREKIPLGTPFFEVPILAPLDAEGMAQALTEGVVYGGGLNYMPWPEHPLSLADLADLGWFCPEAA